MAERGRPINLYRKLLPAEQKEIMRKAILHYGPDMQCITAIEECSELIKEITKLLREHADDHSNVEHLIEEIADVQIMIEQLKIIYRIDNEKIQVQTNYKLNRLNQRMRGRKR